MNGSGIVLFIFLCFFILSLGCGGGPSIADELKLVPGLCFLHIHVNAEMDLDLVPADAGLIMPLWLVDSLKSRGDLGISLLGVNLTDLSPQLMFLSRKVGPDEMAGIGMAGFDCDVEATGEGFDLVDQRGGILGSVAGRDGWTCLVTGSGSDRSTLRWLSMEEGESLAADSDLVAISESGADLTVLVSRNSINFLSVIPMGMLDRRQITYLNMARNIISDIGIRAVRISLDTVDEEPRGLFLELQLVRQDGYVTSLSAGFSDTGIAPDSLLAYLVGFYGP
jgi:hypothetical protein